LTLYGSDFESKNRIELPQELGYSDSIPELKDKN